MISRNLILSIKAVDGSIVETQIRDFPAMAGRSGECGIRLASKSVSGIHSKFFSVCGRFFIMDNDSTNGTFINGRKIKGGFLHKFESGDILRMADCELTVKASGEMICGGTRTALASMIEGLNHPEPEKYLPCLLMLNGSKAGSALPLSIMNNKRELSFKQEMDFISITHEPASCENAIFTIREDRKFHLEIRHGNFISRILNAISRPVVLKDCDRITLNKMEILFLCPESFHMEDAVFDQPGDQKLPRGLLWLVAANFILAAISIFLSSII